MPSSRSTAQLASTLRIISRLTARDVLLLDWLAEHHVLTLDQIDLALFGSRRYAQRRLATLAGLGVLARFSAHVGTPQVTTMRYTLGPQGHKMYPQAADFAPIPGRRRGDLTERLSVLSRHPRLPHLLGVNGFFTALHAHHRAHPDQVRLSRWWSEQHATAAFTAYPGAAIRPDGHGVWSADGRHTGFFLEHDTGSEPLTKLLKKLPAYTHLAHTGLRYPVLIHVHSERREANLLAALAQQQLHIIVATSVHGADHTGPVWAVPGEPERLRLSDLPCQHGPVSALNPARFHAPDSDHP